MMTSIFLRLLLFVMLCNPSPCLAQEKYNAPWISYPTASVTDYGVYHFRKSFSIEDMPNNLLVHLSADNRYHFFVNGQRVSYGPAKGDLKTYKYDVVDIAPYLKSGKNILAALVYNAGKDKPMSLLSVQTAFFMSTENNEFKNIETNSTWKTLKNEAYQPVSYYEMLFKERWFYGYYACGPGDNVNGEKYPWNWEQLSFDDSSWGNAEQLSFDGDAPWNLVPRNIAFMDNHREKPMAIRKVEGVVVSEDFLIGKEIISIPANKIATIVLDYKVLTMGYPELIVNRGKGSSIKIKYAEALYDAVNMKAHRDSVQGKIMFGVWDVFFPDGGINRMFRPLWKRTGRYVQFEIETKEEPLEIISYENEYSGYPYVEMATFSSNDKKLNEIFDMGQRTLQMCSGETYYDTPYYEQLSYGGDNRPIAALSTYNSTDDRLLREVMKLYPQSVNKETGLFKSAYPSRFDFDMAGWSLAWIQSLHDYYYMRGDLEYIRQFVSDIDGVLGFFHRHMDEQKGILGAIKSDVFMDWSISKGNIPRNNNGDEIVHSTMLSLYYAHTLDCVVRLYEQMGFINEAKKWQLESKKIKAAVLAISWDKTTKLFTDYPNKTIFSQHTNLLAILCDVVPLPEQKELLQRILEYKEFDEYASSYFSYFLFKAIQKTGQENLFFEHLDFWYKFIERGHTTVGETGFASHDRSDCHAWSAHPSYYLLSLVSGINPKDIGFNHVNITPHLGKLTKLEAAIPHPKGRISVKYEVKRRKLKAIIVLPKHMNGSFVYSGQSYTLKSGSNIFNIRK